MSYDIDSLFGNYYQGEINFTGCENLDRPRLIPNDPQNLKQPQAKNEKTFA